MKTAKKLYAGIMTGNSMDAADAVLLSVNGNKMQVVASARKVMPSKLATELRFLAEGNAATAAEFMLAQNKLTKLCAAAFQGLNTPPSKITAIGCHGQTICHNPARGYSWQMLDGALLAELTKCNVVCDFRSRDIAAGGQGAPLAPYFHYAVFADYAPCAIINIGGIANITMIDKNKKLSAFDTGPGCILIDDWHRKNRKGNYDKDGKWASGGKVITPLLNKWQRHSFFKKQPPKSCGREEFSPSLFCNDYKNHNPQDIQTTLTELTAKTITNSITKNPTPLYLCGGGARNNYLIQRIKDLSKTKINLTTKIGIPPEQMEATAFAWLSHQHTTQTPLKTPTPRIPGTHYPK